MRRFLPQIILLAACTLGAGELKAQNNEFDVFYVVVGSSTYAAPRSSHEHGFGDLPEAMASAEKVSELLQKSGARFGITLTSGAKSFVSVADIEAAMGDVNAEIAKSKAPHPLLLFYFVGHGISEGIAWNHFSVPGTLLLTDRVSKIDVAKLAEHTLYTGALVDELKLFKLPFLVILDTCYEGKRRRFDTDVLSEKASQNIKDVSAVLRVLNEFRDTYPVLFSTTPGNVVSTVEDPLDPNDLTGVGPLGRRVMIILNNHIKSHSSLSLRQFLLAMGSKDLDTVAAPAVARSPMPAEADLILFAHGSAGSNQTRRGTATKADLCCR